MRPVLRSPEFAVIPELDALPRLIVDPKAYAEWRTLLGALAVARREQPLFRVEAPGFDPFWVVTRADDIRDVEGKPQVFRQNGVRVALYSRVGLAAAARQPPNLSMTVRDAPEHAKLRGITAGWFSPGRIKSLRETLRPIAAGAVRRMMDAGGRCEFAEDIAVRFPLQVILSILGVPPSEEEAVLRLTQRVFRSGRDEDGDGTGSPTNNAAVAEFREYFGELSDQRRRRPTDDLASVIANALLDGDAMPEALATAYYITIATAGHDTTSAALSGAIWGLCDYPEQLRGLRDKPERLDKLPDEAVRWSTPVQHFMRTAAEPYELQGRTLQPGDWLMLCYPSGNRDETLFQTPEAFSLERDANPHVGFGFGPHMCLGMHLARLELRLFFEELLPHLKHLALDGAPARASSYFVGGPNYVPISYELN
jgi:hypothetical protein